MYFKDKKDFKKCICERGKSFIYYDFNQIQKILETGEYIQKCYSIHEFFMILKIKIESHPNYKPDKMGYDFETGFTHSEPKPINQFLSDEESKRIKKIVTKDLPALLDELPCLHHFFKDNRNINNIRENLKIFKEYPDLVYLTSIESIERNCLELWDSFRAYLDRINNEIKIPEPNEFNVDYFGDILEARDIFCMGHYRTALLVIGRTIETLLLELGFQSQELINKYQDWSDRVKFPFENRLNILFKSDIKMIDDETMYREILTLIRYRHEGGHPLSSVSEIERIRSNSIHQINIGIKIINDLSYILERKRIENDKRVF